MGDVSDYRVVALPAPIPVEESHVAQGLGRTAEVVGLVIDRSFDRGIHIASVIVVEPGRTIRLGDREAWSVREGS